MPLFEAYHGVSPDEHQRRFDRLSATGYRMISLSVYGPPKGARYAAVWVQRPGPNYVAFHGRSAANYQSMIDTLTPQGFVPVLLSATGGPGGEIFAGVFEQLGTSWAGRHGITADELDSDAQSNAKSGLQLTELSCYGTAAQPLFAAVWQQLPSSLHESWWRSFDGSTYEQLFDAIAGHANRPFLVAPSPGPFYHAIFLDDSVGSGTARHGIGAAEYQSEVDKNLAAGRLPICVRATGSSSDWSQDIYCAVFATDNLPEERIWTATGAPTAGLDSIEAIVREFMIANGIRAGSMALALNGATVVRRAFTFAEVGYPVTQPDALFRLASLSKIFTSAAIGAILESLPVPRRAVFINERIFPLLDISLPRLAGQTVDSRANSITLAQLIDHQGGWMRGVAVPSLHPKVSSFDPCSGPGLRLIGQDLGYNHPPSAMDVAQYMYGEPLQFAPGTSTASIDQRYSNFGYLLLGLAVEKNTGQAFYDYLMKSVLAPIGVADVLVANSLTAAPREVGYQSVNAVPSVMRPDLDPAFVSEPYGGLCTETTVASGGLIATAEAVVQTIARYAVWGVGGRSPGLSRIGNMAGTFTCASSRGNGYDWAVMFNNDDGLDDTARNNFLNGMNTAVDALE